MKEELSMKLIAKISLFLAFCMYSAFSLAEGAPVQPQGPSAMMQLVFFGGFILIFYFFGVKNSYFGQT